MGYEHEAEAQPLSAQLSNSKQSSGTLECLNFLAAADGGPRWRHREDVGESGSR